MLTLTFQLAVVLLTLTLSDAFRAPLKQQTLVTVARSCQQDSSSSSSSGSSSILYKSILKKLTATALSGLVFMNQMPVEPAAASSAASSLVSSSFQVANKLEDANSKLGEYSLPPMLFIPPGFSPLVSEIGRGNIKEAMTNPIVVQFVHPSNWVVQKTSVNVNGEAGTVSANDFVKGDSAFLFLLKSDAKGALDPARDKELIRNFILKSLSQKGDPVDDLKILRVQQGAAGVDGTKYLLVDFKYQLNTEAGFLINRQAVLSLTNVGDGYLQGLVSVTTDKRWRNNNMEPQLRSAAESFRVYKLNSGVFASGGLGKPASEE